MWETEVPPPPCKTIKAPSYFESFLHSWLSPENSQDSSCKSDLTFTVNIFLRSFCISGATHTQGKQALSVSSCTFGAPWGNTHSVWLRLSWGLVKKLLLRCPSRSRLEDPKHPSGPGASADQDRKASSILPVLVLLGVEGLPRLDSRSSFGGKKTLNYFLSIRVRVRVRVCMHITCMSGACRSQKRAFKTPLEPEL